jgi:hypothetical protein
MKEAETRRKLERAVEFMREARAVGAKRREVLKVINDGTEALHVLRRLDPLCQVQVRQLSLCNY